MSASSSLGYVISCCLECTLDSTVALVLGIVLQSLYLKFSEQNKSKWIRLWNFWADLHYLMFSGARFILAVNWSCPKAYYAMYSSKYVSFTFLTCYTAITPSNLFCELIINALGQPLLKALNCEHNCFKSKLCDNIILKNIFWYIKNECEILKKSKVFISAVVTIKWMTALWWRLYVQKSEVTQEQLCMKHIFKRFIIFFTLSKLCTTYL